MPTAISSDSARAVPAIYIGKITKQTHFCVAQCFSAKRTQFSSGVAARYQGERVAEDRRRVGDRKEISCRRLASLIVVTSLSVYSDAIGKEAEMGDWPPQAEAMAIWHRLVDGDPVAPSDLAVAYLDPLAGWLTASSPAIDPALCQTAAEDAILALITRPEAYHPERAALDTYLRVAARGDLKNAIDAETRRRSRTAAIDAVELSPAVRNRLHDDDADPARIVELAETVRERVGQAALPAGVSEGLSAGDREVLALMRVRERRTELYARAMGILHLPIDEQRRQVKRAKDRLNKRLERARE